MHKCILACDDLSVMHEKARTWRALWSWMGQSVIGGYFPLTESL